jgi:hypothetical protein
VTAPIGSRGIPEELRRQKGKQCYNSGMSLAYRIVFECPKGRHNINVQKRCSNTSLSEAEAMKIFGNEDLACTNPNCGWHGKASKTKLLRILPFTWILSPAT